MNRLKQIFAAILFISCIGAITPSYARDDNNQRDNNRRDKNKEGNDHGDTTLPINGGIVFLFVAGAAIGATVIYKNNKRIIKSSNV